MKTYPHIYVKEIEGEQRFGWFVQLIEDKRSNLKDLGFYFLAMPCGQEHFVFCQEYGHSEDKIDTNCDPRHSRYAAQQEVNARAVQYIRKAMKHSSLDIKTCFGRHLNISNFERLLQKRGFEFIFSTSKTQ